jgi:hypothetical protein
LHQQWLDISSARFWKSVAHHYLRMAYDMLAVGISFTLVVFAVLGPAAAMAVSRSDDDAGLHSSGEPAHSPGSSTISGGCGPSS